VQGVIKSYDPATRQGSVICDKDLVEYELADDALEGSLFRMIRQGQRVVFGLNDAGLVTGIHIGSEVDMGTPGFPPDDPSRPPG
jgi:CspA family cold shock protein